LLLNLSSPALAAWAVLLALPLAPATKASAASPPNVVFILLDATRADRFGAWGNPRPTTPALDALGAAGAVFARHFANAHSTRSSMPQLMSGRYYAQSILRSFLADEHPREYAFSRPEATGVLLPDWLRAHGYRTVGVSAHPWVVADSPFGRGFDRLDFVAADPVRGHADAPEVVEHALKLWREREPSQPLFLYVHLMDMHTPRFLPEMEPRFPVPGFEWRTRFADNGDPTFELDARRWVPNDARDFTPLDVQHFTAVYDTRLAFTDEQLARLFAALRAGDPDLAHTVVVVTADHGEELGEDGRTDHFDSLVDTVQHIPLIVAGGGVLAGQRTTRLTEAVDVAPSLLRLLGLPAPPGIDGRTQLTADGRVCAACGKSAVYYAWEDYRATRTARYLLRERAPGSFEARCAGADELYRLRSDRRRRITLDPTRFAAVTAGLHRRLVRRLEARERTFRADRYGAPTTTFLVRPDFWRLADDARVACVPVDVATGRRALAADGWLWSGRGATILHADGGRPLALSLSVPAGYYGVDAGVVPMKAMPWFSGFERWRARSFLSQTPIDFVPLGTLSAVRAGLALTIPAEVGAGNHVVALRLSPVGALPPKPPAPIDRDLQERLKALGYVN
jgi:arylsulfatase A-like enzyme